MNVHVRSTHKWLFTTLALCLLGTPLAEAAGIRLQNANFATSDRKVIVQGKLEGFPGPQTVTLRSLTTEQILATTTTKANKFSFAVRIPSDAAVPCAVAVEVGSEPNRVARSAQLRNASRVCPPYKLALRGRVTDEPIPFATVAVTVGGLTYTAIADQNGEYLINVASTSLTELLKIEASGVNQTGEPIQFVNLSGTFARLVDDQLADGSAEANVTNVTTANYVLLAKANGGQAPTTEEALRTAETSVNATELLQLAAVIKLIVDNPDYSLPEGQTSLLEFVSNPSAVQMYLLDAVDPTDLQAALTEILEDTNLVAGFSALDLPPQYFVIPAAHPGYLARSGSILELAADGTGRILAFDPTTQNGPINEPFGWAISNGRLVLTLTNQPEVVSFMLVTNAYELGLLTQSERDQLGVDGTLRVPVRQKLLSSAYTRVTDGTLVDTAAVEDRVLRKVDPFTLKSGGQFTPSIDYAPAMFSSTQTLRASLDVRARPFAAACPAPAGATCVPGTWLATFMYSPGTLGGESTPLPIAPNGDVVTFAAGGSVTGRISGETASWSVDAEGALVIDYPQNGWRQKVTIVDTLGIEYGVFSELTRADGSRFADFTINVKAPGSFALGNAYLANAPTKYWQGEINQWIPSPQQWETDSIRAYTSYFGWQFFADSNAAINVQRVELDDCDGDGRREDLKAILGLSEWQAAGDTVEIPRPSNFGLRLRTWYPGASVIIDGDRQFYVMEVERFVSGSEAGKLFFAPRVNFLREIPARWTCSN